ncbi:hypothetical protein [Methyloversatilis sp.]|uniref:hypothetical protein n=1 Tax=Methyloversatilis sp. TaxID=2569862 RepID=UPI002735EA24|nr:hypothetical protein [Methyloversatilis sp.]MDP2868471.1 hypothetical protein [Methyloversatilis sp.]MDP3456573.1 hypothetical protein [Methyloversatilis sp.]MDP3579264.1 hypothetical protein [Methyloversatilis sp.]
MNACSNLLRPWLRTYVLLLLVGALPLQAFALQCQVRCALAGPAMPGDMHIDAAMDGAMSDSQASHDCHEAADAIDDCPNGAQCAAAHAIALPVTGTAHATAGIDMVSTHTFTDRPSHTPLPPERPPRHG